MSTKTHRPRGRPRTGGISLRSRLLDAALGEIAATGLSTGLLRQAALRTGATPALAHYYFSDRNGLLEALLRERALPVLEQLLAPMRANASRPVAALTCFVQQYSAAAARNPWLPRLATEASHPANSLFNEMIAVLRELVANAQVRGELRRDLPADYIALSLLGLCSFPFLARGTGIHGLRANLDSTASTQLTLQHLALLQDGISTHHLHKRTTTDTSR
jgi:TetR/AcrR family transcriptional regulator